MRRASSLTHRPGLISVLLMALVVRALIPAGFMPATDRPFSFQICPDGFPAHLLRAPQSGSARVGSPDAHAAQHHHTAIGEADAQAPASHANHEAPPHRHSSASSEHCVFAVAAGAGPLAFVPVFSAQAVSLQAPVLFYVSPILESQRFRIQQPRGPPALS